MNGEPPHVFQNADGVLKHHAGNQWQSSDLPTLAAALEVPCDQDRDGSILLGAGLWRR